MLRIYNSLSRKIEDFTSINDNRVGIYTCGPTVYDFAHIGNFRTYATADLLIRVLQFNNYNVKYIMNLTDVGHLTGDNAGDADTGEDRMEKSAKKEGKSAWEIAEFYADQFKKDYSALHLSPPEKFTKATDHIKEQIDLIRELEEKGYTYQTSDGIYFDTSAFPEYGKLSNLDEIKEGARVEVNPEKRNPRDFALWKFSYPNGVSREEFLKKRPASVRQLANYGEARQMEWKSPWGKGFPGWHIECSAMSLKYLTEAFDPFGKLRIDDKKNYTIDIHVGGIDLRETHHPNEIAQSEAATGKPFVKYWVHSAFMLVQGERMSKSKGNNYRLYDLEKEAVRSGRQGFDPLSLRYLYMQTHYRQEMNFTFSALGGAQQALSRLKELVVGLKNNPDQGDTNVTRAFDEQFVNAINDDLNMPQALAAMWEMLKSDASNTAKLNSLLRYDKVLGFDLEKVREEKSVIPLEEVPEDVRTLVEERQRFRKTKRFNLADQWRNKIKKRGFEVLDTPKGIEIKKL